MVRKTVQIDAGRVPTGAVGAVPVLVSLGFLWLGGNCLRLTILSVPPLLPAIHSTLHLDEAAVGALTALPVLLLAVVAIPGSFVIARLGPRRALLVGLLLLTLAGAARGLGPSSPVLFAMSLVMGVGVAVAQPSLPSLVKLWIPGAVAQATAVYTNGMLVGEILPVAVTVPLIMPAVNHSWPLALAFWSLPAALTLIGVLISTTHVPRAVEAPPVAWWPNWRDSTTWRLGLVLGCAASAYFGSNAFLPDFLRHTHHSDLITPALTVLNLSQLPSSLLIAFFPRQVVGRSWPIAGAGALIALSVAGFLAGGVWIVWLCGVLGFAIAIVFVLGLTLPPMLVGADEVHRLSSATFAIMYSGAFLASFAGGVIWDATGLGITAFSPMMLAGAVMVVLALTLRLPHVAQ